MYKWLEAAYHTLNTTTDSDLRERVELGLKFDVERVCAHPEVRENADRVALRRGPLVYASKVSITTGR